MGNTHTYRYIKVPSKPTYKITISSSYFTGGDQIRGWVKFTITDQNTNEDVLTVDSGTTAYGWGNTYTFPS